MTREQTLVESFVELADTLVDDFDVIDFLHTLAARSVELLAVSAAGIMLADPDGGLRHAACSSEEMRLVELFELQLEEGPCFDAFRFGQAVQSGSPEDVRNRWPRFADRAAESGFVTVAAVPMRLRSQIIGALNLFSTEPGTMGAPDARVAQAMADVATIGLLQERAIADARTLSGQLQGALESRVVIEQAKGIIAEFNHIDVDTAFGLLRNYARKRNRPLSSTARAVVAGALQPAELGLHR
jgi:hypothetical protein